MKLPGASPRNGGAAKLGAVVAAACPLYSHPTLTPRPAVVVCHDVLVCDVDAAICREHDPRAPPRADGEASEPLRQLRIAAFLAVLLLGYTVTRAIAHAGLPSDGRRHWQGGDIAADVGRLLESGVVLGWLLGVDEAARFRWLRSRRAAPWMLPLFLGVGPAYSALNSVHGLQVSLADLGAWGATAWVALGVGALAAAALLGWHVRHAWRTLPRAAAAAYFASRAAPFAFYSIAVGAATAAFDGGNELRSAHLHHLYIAWALAACARFNHPVSGALLALAAGVFVQGVGAYGFAPLVEAAGCRTLALPESAAMGIALSAGCTWNSALLPNGMARLRVCPADQPALAESLFMKCKPRNGL